MTQKIAVTSEIFEDKQLEAIKTSDFSALVAPAAIFEKLTLRALLKRGEALPLKTIRSAVIEDLATDNKLALLTAQGFPNHALGGIKQPDLNFWLEMINKANTLSADDKEGKEEYYFRLSVLRSFMPREIIQASGYIEPLNYTQKIGVWEKALRHIDKETPSLHAIERAIDTLEHYPKPLIEERPYDGSGKAKLLYYVAPFLVKVWQHYTPGPKDHFWRF
jgi:hypothetical protein